METMKVTQLGVLNMYGSRYAVLDGAAANENWMAAFMSISYNIPYFTVAKEFIVERIYEGITMNERVYVTPHKVSISGDFMIEWFPKPKEIEVLIPADGDVINE